MNHQSSITFLLLSFVIFISHTTAHASKNLPYPGITTDLIVIPFGLAGKLIVFQASVNNQKGFVCFDSVIKGALLSPILGFHGWDLFEDFELLIDYEQSEIQLFAIDEQGELLRTNRQLSDPDDIYALNRWGYVWTIDHNSGNQDMRMTKYTGGVISVVDKNMWKEWCGKNNEPLKANMKAFDSDENEDEDLDQKCSMKDDRDRLATMCTVLMDLGDLNYNLPGPKIIGILGNENLCQLRTSLNFKKNTMKIWYGSSIINMHSETAKE